MRHQDRRRPGERLASFEAVSTDQEDFLPFEDGVGVLQYDGNPGDPGHQSANGSSSKT
jgi:hypothetical protein